MPAVSTQSVVASKARRELIDSTGRLFQLLGLPKTTGQIYGLLYLSTKALSLDDMVELLAISKGSVSLGTRHLATWGAVRQVWVPGDRRDYFEAVGDLGTVLKSSYQDFIKPRLVNSQKRLATMVVELDLDQKEGRLSSEEHKFCLDRLKQLSKMQKKILAISPVAEKLL